MQRKILLCLNQGFAIRYFLKTDFLKKLIDEKYHVVILSSFAKSESFKREFSNPHITLDFFDIKKLEGVTKSKIYVLMYYCRIYGLNLSIAVEQKLKRERDNAQKNGWRSLLKFYFLYYFTGMLRKSKILRDFFVWIDNRYTKELSILGPILKKHEPSVILVPSLGFIFPDVHMIKVAKIMKIPVFAALISWDNTTTKGMTTVYPDHVFAWTQIMKKELIDLHGFSEEKITISGVTSFDVHSKEMDADFKDKIFSQLKLKSNDKYIFLGLGSPTYQHEPNMETIQVILSGIRNNQLKTDKLVIRLHPNYVATRRQSKAEEMHSFLNKMIMEYGNILIINQPYKAEGEENWYSSENDVKILSLLLRNSDVVVCFYSTLILETVLFDIPILNISYDAGGYNKNRNNSSGREYVHIERLFSYGAVTEVMQKNALIKKIEQALKNPKELSLNRKKVFEMECGINKGSAGNALALDVIKITEIFQTKFPT